jgi:hypothetical protein
MDTIVGYLIGMGVAFIIILTWLYIRATIHEYRIRKRRIGRRDHLPFYVTPPPVPYEPRARVTWNDHEGRYMTQEEWNIFLRNQNMITEEPERRIKPKKEKIRHNFMGLPYE